MMLHFKCCPTKLAPSLHSFADANHYELMNMEIVICIDAFFVVVVVTVSVSPVPFAAEAYLVAGN